ncbi:MAG: membrane integrity-associated transporter subunit PqiC [Gammaproteobacteria bacterium]|nr:membrane integrity-associated transporter subunit PqiC [Gammaproteobacteria bacterium]MBU1979498.1 membrane integrity-associated transporter subunit PqiC [Gammaproteobacteria bacterium]
MKQFFGKKWDVKITAALLTLVLTGCSTLRPIEAESVRAYLLEAQIDPTEQVKLIPLVLIVSSPRAVPGYDTVHMAFIRQPHMLEYFAKNRWAEAPAKMLGPLLVRTLELRTGFKAVASSDGMVKGDVRLDTEITLLQQEFTTSPSRMHMRLRVQLVEQSSYRVLATQVFDAVEAAPTDDPYGGVIAANLMLPKLLGQIADFAVMNGVSFSEYRK